MSYNLRAQLLSVVELSERVGDLFELWGFEGADHAYEVEDGAAECDVLLINLLMFLILLQKMKGLADIFGEVGDDVDPDSWLNHQKRLLVYKLGVEGEIFEQVLEVAQYFHFQLNQCEYTWKYNLGSSVLVELRKLDSSKLKNIEGLITIFLFRCLVLTFWSTLFLNKSYTFPLN